MKVVKGSEQPVEIHLREYPGRPFKPGKSMRRVLVAIWGPDSAAYVGRTLTLYGDPGVKFGGQVVGGIRISHMSHMDKPVEVSLTVTRGKRAPFKVTPPTTKPTQPVDHLTALVTAPTMDALQAAWGQVVAAGAGNEPDLVAAKDQRKTELTT